MGGIMATMTDTALLVQFANACKAQLHTRWTTFPNAAARARKVFDITCAVLDVCRVPRPSLELTAALGGASGLFDFATWKIKVDPRGFGAAVPTRDQFLQLITLIFHEARHCEQWFQMARYAAVGHQMTAARLASSLYIPKRIASIALSRKMGLHDPMLALTRQWYDSVYGAKSGFRGITLGGLMLRRRGDAGLLNEFRNGFHGRYSGVLPEERDAWAIQDRVAEHYRYP
jgi:hypothetical protein